MGWDEAGVALFAQRSSANMEARKVQHTAGCIGGDLRRRRAAGEDRVSTFGARELLQWKIGGKDKDYQASGSAKKG